METLAYTLQKFELGVVLLDAQNRVQALNAFAKRVLGVTQRGDPSGRSVYQVHPAKSREKIELLLRSAERAAKQHAGSPPPVTMLISIPDRVLHIRVSKLLSGGRTVGTCMLFYDLTDVTVSGAARGRQRRPRLLSKLPVYSRDQILLLDLEHVTHVESDGHFTSVHTATARHFCNLSLADLEARLDSAQFVRVHRSYVLNLRHALALKMLRGRAHVAVRGEAATHVPIARSRLRELKEMLGLA
jgi:hypothetical protein